MGEGAGDGVEIGGIGDPDELPGGAGGVRERSEEVEDGADRELLAHRHDEAGRLVMHRREHKAEADVPDAVGDRLGREVDAGAERLEHVGGPAPARGRAVAVLGHRAARAGGDQCRRRGYVEGGPPAARPGGVEQVVAARVDPGGKRTHRAGEAGDLVHRLPLRPQRHQEAGDLDLAGLVGHDPREHVGRLFGAQVRSGGDLVDRRGDRRVGHQSRPAARRASAGSS